MAITAQAVKELRDKTGAGMMDCKKALAESGGAVEEAIEKLRERGLAKAVKRAGRETAEGTIAIALTGNIGAMVELACETDFVAKGDDFLEFANAVATRVLVSEQVDIESLQSQSLAEGSATIDETRRQLVAKLGEKIDIRRCQQFSSNDAMMGSYLHGSRIGVIVEIENGDEVLAKDVAMHVAASKPVCVADSDVPAELIEKEKEIFSAQAAQSGKPPEIIEKMILNNPEQWIWSHNRWK